MWVGEEAIIWGNGAGFDNVILANAYEKCGLKVLWTEKNDRCYRTVRALFPGIKMERTGVAHCAFDDAENQAKHLIRIIRKL